jgi:hypothetical protein
MFLAKNVPLALLFTLPHSVMRISRLQQLGCGRYSRLVYCIISAVTLHIFMALFTPPPCNPVLLVLPMPERVTVVSVGILMFATGCLCLNPRTWTLVGLDQALGKQRKQQDVGAKQHDVETKQHDVGAKQHDVRAKQHDVGTKTPAARATSMHGMDMITWMAVTVHQRSGTLGFVLFVGLAIVPTKVTLGDCITRVVAAIYLRLR